MSNSLYNGQSITANIQVGEKLTVVAVFGNYKITVLDGVGSGTNLATAATGGTYGPYAYSLVVQITASALSEIDYDVGVTTSIVSDTVAKLQSDPLTGGIKGLLGPDGALINGGAPTLTWVQIQQLTDMTVGQRVNCSDYGYAQFIWDGTAWKAAGRIALVSQVTPVTKTDADTANQLAVSFTVPAGLFSVGSTLSFDFTASVNAVVAVNKTMTMTLGGVGIGVFQINSASQSTRVIGSFLAASTSAVHAWWPGNAAVIGQATADVFTSAAVNPTVQNTFALNLSWATTGSGTNTLTLRNFKLWLEP